MIERYYESACYLQFDSYQQFPEVIHGIFTRKGGYSTGPYQGLNSLGALKSGENIDTVIHNRQLAMQALGVLDYPCVTLSNVHGAEVVIPNIRGNWRTISDVIRDALHGINLAEMAKPLMGHKLQTERKIINTPIVVTHITKTT